MWGRSIQRQTALKNARVERGKYRCAVCGGVFSRKKINADHKIAIGRFISFDIFIERLFCESAGIDILCLGCHKIKTKNDKKKMK